MEESRRAIALLKAVTIENSVVKVSHPYAAKSLDELTIQPGELVTVIEKNADGWWKGKNRASGELGWFPANHVIEEATPPDSVTEKAESPTDALRERITVLNEQNSELHSRLQHAGEQVRHMELESQHMSARVRMQGERIRELEDNLMKQSLLFV